MEFSKSFFNAVRKLRHAVFFTEFLILLAGCTKATPLSQLLADLGPFAFSTTATTLPTAYKGRTYTYNFATDNGVSPVTYAISSGSLPGGLSLSSGSGVLSGTVTGSSGNYSFTVTATDSSGDSAGLEVTLPVNLPFSLLTTSLVSAVVNESYTEVLSASGGIAPYTYSATGLPTGLTLNTSTGVLSGTATSIGNYNVTVTVEDSSEQTASADIALNVGVLAGNPSISTTSLSNATLGSTYVAAITVTGGMTPFTYSVSSGTLPTGLTLNSDSGVLTGVPTVVGTSSFTVQVEDALANIASQSYSLSVVQSPAPTITTTTLADGEVAIPYTNVIIASGGTPPYTFSISSGSLPTGLSINSSTGLISGTPTGTGTSSFTVKVVDSLNSSTLGSLSLKIDSSPYETLAIENPNLLPMSLGINDSRTILATGGLPPYTFSVSSGSLPSGLTLNASTGVISGVPGALGTTSFTIMVTDSRTTTASQAYTLQVNSPLVITTASLPVSIVNKPYSVSISANGGTSPYSFSATGVPSGLNLSSAGVLSGTATISSSSSVEVIATDANGLTALQTYTLTVAGSLAISTSSVNPAAVLQSYSQTLSASGGVAPFSFSLASGSLPSGLSLSSAGVLSGTPTKGANAATKTFNFSVSVADASGQTASQSLSMTVTIPPTVLDDISNKLRVGAVGVAYMDWIRESGGYGALTYSSTGLPPGLTVNSTSGVISGTPSAGSAGSYTAAITITDSLGIVGTRNKSMTIVSSGKTAGFDGGITTYLPPGQWQIQDLEAADLNNDGKLDLVMVSYGSTQAVILLGNGDGTFSPYYLALTHQPEMVAIADMNNDGKLDLVFSESTNTVEIVQGDGVWTTPASLTKQQITTGINNNGGEQIAIGDLNGDGRLDIAVANYSANDVLIFMNCGSGGTTVNYNGSSTACTTGQAITNYYAPAATITVNTNVGVGLVDLNSDGKLDLVATNWGNAIVYIFQGNGNGTFNTTASYSQSFAYNTGYVRAFLEPTSTTGWGTTSAAGVPSSANAYYSASSSFIDMNQDGKRDFVVQANYGAYIFLGNNNLGVSQVWTADNSSYGSGAYTKVASINGSAWPDLITSLTGGGVTWMNSGADYGTLVYMNTGSGSGNVGSPSFIPGTYYGALTVGEFITGSTVPALAEARNWSSNTAGTPVIVRPNTGSTPVYNAGIFQFAYENASGYLDNFALASLAIGDINQDGIADVVTKGFSNEAIVNLGVGNGTFNTQAAMIPTGELGAQWWNRSQVILADIDGDGILDFATADWNSGTFSSIDYSIGIGNGTFGSTTYVSTDASGCLTSLGAETIAVGDFNRDGKPDVAVGQGCNGNGVIMVYLGNGDGTLNSASPYTINAGYGTYVDQLVTRDLNGDGILDLAAVTRNGYLQIYYGAGNGTFTQKSVANLNISSDGTALEIGDLNGDGIPDYVISTANYGSFAVALGGTGGTISSISSYSGLSVEAALSGSSVKLVDWNADGKLDVLFIKQKGGGVMYFQGNGDGTFTNPSYLYSVPSQGAYAADEDSLFSVDLNGDGLPDILVTNGDSNSMSSLGISLNKSH